MILEATRDEIPATLKRTRTGQTLPKPLPSHIDGRSRQVWILEIGYTSDTRYLDKLADKQQQHSQLLHIMKTQGYNAMVLPIILGSMGSLYKPLIHTLMELGVPNNRRKKLMAKLHEHSILSLHQIIKLRRVLEQTPSGPHGHQQRKKKPPDPPCAD
jgi:hypothetical protein